MKELMELHEQITVIINNNSDVIHMENENQCLYDNAQQEFYATLNEAEKKFQILPINVHEEGNTNNI